MKKIMSLAVAALTGGGVLTSALDAKAAPTCASLTGSNAVVTIAGSSASQPIWAAIATHLTGISIIYQAPSSCVGLSDVTTGATETTQPLFMDGSAAGVQCTGSNPVDIGVSDVFPASCGSAITWPAAGFQDFPGPVQAMAMAVPYTSTANSISADAAYVVFGWGASNPQYEVQPWTTYDQVFIRTPTSGTETMIGSAIGLASSKWLSQAPDAGASQEQTSTGNLLKALQAAAAGATPSAAIGILSVTNADTYRGALGQNDAGTPTGGLKVLAFQAKDQDCGYLPDSDATHYDKINVRQGRYDIWGPLHLVTAVSASDAGTPTNTSVAAVIDYVNAIGLATADVQTSIQASASAHLVPQCAMQVSRSAEVSPVQGGGIASYQPPIGCGCYFESLVNGGTPYSKYCTACTSDSSCTSPSYSKCNFGYCEAQ